jgi:hypothetical protein
MSDRAERFRPLFRTLCLALVAACGEDNPLVTPPPTTGMSTILVTLNTTGTAPDSNGYRIVVDQGASHAIAASEAASLTLTVPPGSHSIELTDVAAHCVVSGGNPRLVATSAFGTTGVTFRVNCPHLATLKIRTSTSGTSLDLDGYLLNIDGTPKGSLGVQDSIVLDDLQPAQYRVRLSSVVGNCSVAGGSWRVVQMEDGEVETLDLPVTCVPRLDDLPGETLVVSSRSIFDEDYNLYLLRGTARQRLTDHVGDEVIPEFSPDADRILFLQSTNSGRFLRVLDRVTRQETLLPTPRVERAVWSPDGSRIAFARDGRLFLINSDGSGEVPLTSGSTDREPYWSPDGTRIAFTRSNAVHVVNADGTGLRQVSPDKRLSGPWSPDGRSLIITVLEEACDAFYYYYCYYYTPTVVATDLVNLDLETGQEIALTHTAGVAKWSPAWSADGQRLFFVSAQTGNSDVYMVGASGATPVNLTMSPEQENWVSVGVVPAGSASVSGAAVRRR